MFMGIDVWGREVLIARTANSTQVDEGQGVWCRLTETGMSEPWAFWRGCRRERGRDISWFPGGWRRRRRRVTCCWRPHHYHHLQYLPPQPVSSVISASPGPSSSGLLTVLRSEFFLPPITNYFIGPVIILWGSGLCSEA